MDWRKLTPWALLLLAGLTLFAIWNDTSPQRKHVTEIGFSDLVAQIEDGRVHDLTISGNNVAGRYQDNRTFSLS